MLKAHDIADASIEQPKPCKAGETTHAPMKLAELISVDEYIQRIEEMYGCPLDTFPVQCARVIHLAMTC